jgi:hypothetical protein
MNVSQTNFQPTRKAILALLALSKMDKGEGVNSYAFHDAMEDARGYNYNPTHRELETLGLVEEFQYTPKTDDQTAAIAESLKASAAYIKVIFIHEAERARHLKKTAAAIKQLQKATPTAKNVNEIIGKVMNFTYTKKVALPKYVYEPAPETRYRLTQAGKNLLNGLTVNITVK